MQSITSDRIKSLNTGYSAQSWQEITPTERTQVCEAVRQDLKDQGLPQVIDNIVRWRLSQLSREDGNSAARP